MVDNFILTTGEIIRITGIPKKVLRNYIHDGPVDVPGGGGIGRHFAYSPQHALGFMVVARMLDTWHGCDQKRAASIVKAFTRVDDEWLDQAFETHGPYFVCVYDGLPRFSNEAYAGEAVDVEACRKELREKTEELKALYAKKPLPKGRMTPLFMRSR